MEFLKKRMLVLAALLLGLVASGGPVSAAPPADPNPNAPFSIDGDGQIIGQCPFIIDYIQTGKAKVIGLPSDRTTIIFPGASITLKANDKTVTYNVTGTVHEQLMTDSDGNEFIAVQVTGRNLLTLPEPNPGLVLTIGNFHYTLNNDEKRTERTRFNADGPGQVIDVCAVLS